MARFESALALACPLVLVAGGRLFAQGAPTAAKTDQSAQQKRGRENRAQEPGSVLLRKQGAVLPILDWRHGTGDWGGAHTWLEEQGDNPEILLTTDASVVASGGADEGGTALRSLLDVTFMLDGARLFGLPESLFLVVPGAARHAPLESCSTPCKWRPGCA